MLFHQLGIYLYRAFEGCLEWYAKKVVELLYCNILDRERARVTLKILRTSSEVVRECFCEIISN